MEPIRSARVEVDLSAIRGNAAALRRLAGPSSGLCAVVKADAYGHGALPVAKAALEGGASMLAVALIEEGCALRAAGIAAPILVLGGADPAGAAAATAADLEVSVYTEAAIAAFGEAARKAGKRARLHLKIDTGMNRVGCSPEEAPALAARIARESGAELAGIFTHFANADDPDLDFAREQLARYLHSLELVASWASPAPLRHAANSAATLWFPESRLDMVRAGIALYGLNPAAGRDPGIDLAPALSIRASVVRLRTVEAGETVSYGRIWTARRRSRIATIPVGYADGYPRAASNGTWAGFGDRRLPQVGRVCMDMCMFDATEAPELREGDELVLAGPGGPSLDELAALAHTINYELACHATIRLPRVHVDTRVG